MKSLSKLERDYLFADRAAVEDLLAQLTDEDVLTRLGLESRLKELNQEIDELEGFEDERTASVTLVFGGDPVIGGRGIESGFGGEAVMRFQDLVAKVRAKETHGLGSRGGVPGQEASMRHITGIARGSFGFVLEEAEAQAPMFNTPLKGAVDRTLRLLQAFCQPDDSQLDSAVQAIDQRTLDTARGFLELMRRGGATLRIAAGDRETRFLPAGVARGAERAKSVDTVARQDEPGPAARDAS